MNTRSQCKEIFRLDEQISRIRAFLTRNDIEPETKIEALEIIDDGDVVQIAADVAVGLGVFARTQHLHACAHCLHHRTIRHRIYVFHQHAVER